MKFAFTTTCCPTWSLDTIAAMAKHYGYDGVEIQASPGDSLYSAGNSGAGNPFLTDVGKIRSRFDASGVRICCLSSSISYAGKEPLDRRSAEAVRACFDAAAALACPLVRLLDPFVPPRGSRSAITTAAARWLVPLADLAADKGVTIVVENALSFRTAREMWPLMEAVAHPAVGVCWDVLNAERAGERPAVSVPVLNRRIAHAHVKAATLTAAGAGYARLGEGDVLVRDFVTRLRGIGYEGWVAFDAEPDWRVDPESSLTDAIARLKEWDRPQSSDEDSDALRDWAKTRPPAKPDAVVRGEGGRNPAHSNAAV